MSQPFILGGSIRFACVVALLVGNRAIAEKLSNELVSEIRNGHKRLQAAASAPYQGTMVRLRGSQGEVGATLPIQLSARFYRQATGEARVDYYRGQSIADDELAEVVVVVADRVSHFIKSSTTGSPYATLFQYGTPTSPGAQAVTARLKFDVSDNVSCLYMAGNQTMLDFIQGTDVDVTLQVAPGGRRVRLQGTHTVESGESLAFAFLLNPDRDYMIESAEQTSTAEGMVTLITANREAQKNGLGYLPVKVATTVNTSFNGNLMADLSYQEVLQFSYNQETPSSELFTSSFFEALGSDVTIVNVDGNTETLGETVMAANAADRMPYSSEPVVPPGSSNWRALNIVNGLFLAIIVGGIYYAARRRGRQGRK